MRVNISVQEILFQTVMKHNWPVNMLIMKWITLMNFTYYENKIINIIVLIKIEWIHFKISLKQYTQFEKP